MTEPPAEPSFGSVLEGLMASRGLHQAALARELGVWDANIGRWRRGGGIDIDNVRKIADYFGVERAYLERLAGYGDSSLPIADTTTNPEIDAILAAERREVHEDFDGIPPKFWPAIMAAQRSARRGMVAALRAALGQDINSDSVQDISTEAPNSTGIARTSRKGRGKGLPHAYDSAGADWHPVKSPVPAAA